MAEGPSEILDPDMNASIISRDRSPLQPNSDMKSPELNQGSPEDLIQMSPENNQEQDQSPFKGSSNNNDQGDSPSKVPKLNLTIEQQIQSEQDQNNQEVQEKDEEIIVEEVADVIPASNITNDDKSDNTYRAIEVNNPSINTNPMITPRT